MPEAKFPTPELNLLSGDEFENQTQGKFLRWALTWGKRIVVLTELGVILAFLSRFWLDTTVADLNEKIAQKKAIAQVSMEFEEMFRRVAARLDKAWLIEKSISLLTVYDETQALIPTTITAAQLNVSKNKISFSGSGDEEALAELVKAFRESKSFADIRVERITKNSTKQIVDFSFQASYAKK